MALKVIFTSFQQCYMADFSLVAQWLMLSTVDHSPVTKFLNENPVICKILFFIFFWSFGKLLMINIMFLTLCYMLTGGTSTHKEKSQSALCNIIKIKRPVSSYSLQQQHTWPWCHHTLHQTHVQSKRHSHINSSWCYGRGWPCCSHGSTHPHFAPGCSNICKTTWGEWRYLCCQEDFSFSWQAKAATYCSQESWG